VLAGRAVAKYGQGDDWQVNVAVLMVLRCVAVCCGMLRFVAVSFGVLQCVAVCCSVLQYFGQLLNMVKEKIGR